MSDTIDNKPKPHNPIKGQVRSVAQIQRDEHVSYEEAYKRYRIEQVVQLAKEMEPIEPKRPTQRDPKSGRFVKATSIAEPIAKPNLQLESFANKNLGKTKKRPAVSPEASKKIEATLTGVVNAVAGKDNQFTEKPTKGEEEEIADAIDDILKKVEQKETTGKHKPVHTEKSISEKTIDSIAPIAATEAILEKIESNTAETAGGVKGLKEKAQKVEKEEKREKITKIQKERVARIPRVKKEDMGFFEGIAHNVKTSPGGKMVKSIGNMFKKPIVAGAAAEGGGVADGLAAGAARFALPAVAIAGIVALVWKGIKDKMDANEKTKKTGIPEEKVDDNYVPESEQPDSESVTNRIKQYEGDNKGSFSKLSKEQREEAFKAGEVGNPAVPKEDMDKYFRKQDLLRQQQNDEAGTTKLQSRPMQRYDNPGSSKFDTGISRPGLGGDSVKQNIYDPNIPTEGKALLETIATHESGGDYNIRQGDRPGQPSLTDLSKFPTGMGAHGISSASGKYQFVKGTWEDAARALNLKDFSPESQDKAAWWLAQRDYARNTNGGNLAVDVKSKDPNKQLAIAQALHRTWTSMPGGYDPGLHKAGRNQQEYLATLANKTKYYADLATPPNNGAQLAQATQANADMKQEASQQPPVVIQPPMQATAKPPSIVADVMPNSRNDDPVLLQAMRQDQRSA